MPLFISVKTCNKYSDNIVPANLFGHDYQEVENPIS